MNRVIYSVPLEYLSPHQPKYPTIMCVCRVRRRKPSSFSEKKIEKSVGPLFQRVGLLAEPKPELVCARCVGRSGHRREKSEREMATRSTARENSTRQRNFPASGQDPSETNQQIRGPNRKPPTPSSGRRAPFRSEVPPKPYGENSMPSSFGP
jgi:hypothetical protein